MTFQPKMKEFFCRSETKSPSMIAINSSLDQQLQMSYNAHLAGTGSCPSTGSALELVPLGLSRDSEGMDPIPTNLPGLHFCQSTERCRVVVVWAHHHSKNKIRNKDSDNFFLNTFDECVCRMRLDVGSLLMYEHEDGFNNMNVVRCVGRVT